MKKIPKTFSTTHDKDIKKISSFLNQNESKYINDLIEVGILTDILMLNDLVLQDSTPAQIKENIEHFLSTADYRKIKFYIDDLGSIRNRLSTIIEYGNAFLSFVSDIENNKNLSSIFHPADFIKKTQ